VLRVIKAAGNLLAWALCKQLLQGVLMQLHGPGKVFQHHGLLLALLLQPLCWCQAGGLQVLQIGQPGGLTLASAGNL
jgi:hypothetical protein